MDTQNLTISLPRALIKKVKVVAARHETSISALLAASLEETVRRAEDHDAAAQRLLARMRAGYDLGSGGELRIARDELHER